MLIRKSQLKSTISAGRSLAPKPIFLLSIANKAWDMKGAISELVDNSFGLQRGNARRVEITYDVTKRILSVFDDGQGMDDIVKAFRLGDSIGLGPDDIGRYGCGGTMAMIWLGAKVRLWTMQGGGRVMRDEVLWKQVMRADSLADVIIGNRGWETATVNNTPSKLLAAGHGTMLELHLRRERILMTEAVLRELTRTYSPGLRSGRRITWTTIRGDHVDTQELSDAALVMPRDHNRHVRFTFVLEYDGKHLPIKGEFGLIDGLPFSRSGAAIGFGPRVIMRTRDCFISLDSNEHFSGKGVAGWVDLGHGWQEYLTTTKDEIHDELLRATLMRLIYKQIESLLRKTEEDQLSIILQGIALDLQGALNQLSERNFTVSVKPKEMRADANPDPTRRPDKPEPSNEIKPKPTPPTGEDEGEGAQGQSPTESRINLVRSTDDEIGGVLCRLTVSSDNETNFDVEINKDHEVVKEMLRAKPINRMGLDLMVTREIAAALIKFPKIIQRALNLTLRQRLDEADDMAQRERLLARLLIDSARRPPLPGDGDDGELSMAA